jgi:heat shock protein HslJ
MKTTYTLIINALIIFLVYGCSNKPATEFGYDPELISSVWIAKEIKGSALLNDTLKLSFDNINNRISGYTGCNRLTGSYTIREGRLVISPATATRFMCPGKSSLENEYLKQLAKSDSLSLVIDELMLFSKSQPTIVFMKK